MSKIAVRHIIDPIDVLIECIKHDPESMGLDICANNYDISIGTGCPYGKVEIMLNTTNKSYYIPVQCIVTFENSQMHVEAYSFKEHLVDHDHYYTATYDLTTPIKVVDACNNIDMTFRILSVCVDNFKDYTSYKDAEDYAAHVISDTIDSFKKFFEPNEY